MELSWKLPKEDIINEVEEIFHNIDTDHNGYIEYEEFIRAAVDPSIFMSKNYLKFAFGYFDHDNSGDISLEEIKKRFMQNSKNANQAVEEQLKNNFDSIDLNGNGSISFEEFCKMMKKIMKT